MPEYTYKCPNHGQVVLQLSMKDAVAITECPDCGAEMPRDFRTDMTTIAEIWACQGAHKTDYDATGDRLEKLNTAWSKATGEKPPPVSREIKRNSRGKQ